MNACTASTSGSRNITMLVASDAAIGSMSTGTGGGCVRGGVDMVVDDAGGDEAECGGVDANCGGRRRSCSPVSELGAIQSGAPPFCVVVACGIGVGPSIDDGGCDERASTSAGCGGIDVGDVVSAGGNAGGRVGASDTGTVG